MKYFCQTTPVLVRSDPFLSARESQTLMRGPLSEGPSLIGPMYEKSIKEKSCSLPIIYLLLLFLSSICIKYLNWEIPNVHNLQQASNPGNNFAYHMVP